MYPDYSFTNHYASIEGLKLHYLDEGDAERTPVLMLHGNPSWSFYYRKLVLSLRDDFRCIVPDHIGMGLSCKPSQAQYPFTLERRVNDLDSLLDQLNIIKNLTLVLHDWGGMIGMAYATRYPERIKKLVILNTAAFHLPESTTIPWQLKLSRIPVLNSILNQGLNAFCRGAVKYCVTRKSMHEDIRKAYLAPYDSWHNRLAVRKFVEDIPLHPGDEGYEIISMVEKGLEQFNCTPILICWGLRDFVFNREFLNEWTRRFPHAQVHSYEDAGHYILEDAGEEIIPIIRDFMLAD